MIFNLYFFKHFLKKLVILPVIFVIIFTLGSRCPKPDKDDDLFLLLLIFILYQLQPKACISNTSQAPVADPLFADQWHLLNTGINGGTAGEDIRVSPVISSGNRGENVQVVVVDDGVELNHEDIEYNVNQHFSVNYGGSNPEYAYHGTAVAGVIAASDTNGVGLHGVAPGSCLASYDLLNNYTFESEYDAMTRNIDLVDVMNNSWGPEDGLGNYVYSNPLWRESVEFGLANGRKKKGTVYVWAAGNGGRSSPASAVEIDNSNYDGYANFYGVMAICAVGNQGTRAFYSEKGANLWVCTPSLGDNGIGISTTDRTGSEGFNKDGTKDYTDISYTKRFGGTSSAAPVAAGAAALVLKANPMLTWRDVKIILAKSARMNDPSDADWAVNGAGYNINHKYGFGVVNAQAAVSLATGWANVGPFKTSGQYLQSVNAAIPDNDLAGVTGSIAVAGSGISKIEYVEITLYSNHTYAGDLNVTLTSPGGTSSVLAEKHSCGSSGCGSISDGWPFGSARHLDESADGTWSLKVADEALLNTGSFTSWSIRFYGR